MNGLFSALQELTVVVAPVLAQVEAGPLPKPGPWRPPEWKGPALTSLTVPAPATQSVVTDPFGQALPGAAASPKTPPVYVFDAILRAEHQRELKKTEHPIQAAPNAPTASITDHAFLLPARVRLDLAMSDAMASYTPNAWGGGASKSVSAYQTLVSLQAARTLVTLTTRLATYSNMIVESITPTETRETRHGLRASVLFSEVFIAASAAPGADASSTRPQTTGSTASGVVQTLPTTNALSQQNNVTAPGAAAGNVIPKANTIPGAGAWSSVSLSRLRGLLG